jgi:hypothetical protein
MGAATQTGPCLVAVGPIQRRPSPAAGLLLERFAAIAQRPTNQAIIGFANQFGWLTAAPIQLQVIDTDAPTPGEPLQHWKTECRDFADLWSVWRAVDATRASDRAQRILPATRWFLQSDAARPGAVMDVDADPPLRDTLLHRIRHWLRITHSTDALEPYRYYVARRSLERLSGQITPTVDQQAGAGICLMADSLLAAIYWELATVALAGSRRS